MQGVAEETGFVITILPSGKQIKASRGTRLLDALSGAGCFPDKSVCFGAGVCCGCEVLLIGEHNARRVKSCRTYIESDYILEIPADSLAAIPQLSEYSMPKQCIQPCCRRLEIQLPDGGTMSEWERLERGLSTMAVRIDKPSLPVLRQLAEVTRAAEVVSVVVCENEILSVSSSGTPGNLYGIAFDLGSTTVVGYLYELTSARFLSAASLINPQSSVASDIMSRIRFTETDRIGTRKMARMLQLGLKEVTDQLVQLAHINREEIYEVVVAGNPCMQQMLMEVPVAGLGQAPYRLVTTDPIRCRASEIGLHLNEMAALYCMPCIGGFVGGDAVGMQLVSFPDGNEDNSGISLAVDIGTNCEIVLTAPNMRIACSAAAGPAFEGGAIYQGMRAEEGAIDRVRIDGDVEVHVIGDKPAQGLCGSGLVDSVAELLRIGIVDPSGRMLDWKETEKRCIDSRLLERLTLIDGIQTFLLSGSHRGESQNTVMLTQMDIRQLQLAKSAIQSAIHILLDIAGLKLNEVGNFYLAGAFGSSIDGKNASRIGIVPAELQDRIRYLGNAAGSGASRVLLSAEARATAERLARSTRHVSLADHADFESLFLQFLCF